MTHGIPLWGARCRPTWGVVAPELEPSTREFDGANLVAFVLSVNLHRRHMSPGQQAAILASAQDWGRAQTRGGDRKTDQSQAFDFDSVEKRASASGASRITQMKADRVAMADPELARKVGHGTVSLLKALAQVESKATPRERDDTPSAVTVTTPVSQAPEQAQDEDDNSATVTTSFQGARRGRQSAAAESAPCTGPAPPSDPAER